MFAGRFGPAFLEISIDVLLGAVKDSEIQLPQNYRTEIAPRGDPSAIERAAALVQKAELPAVIAGSAIWWSNASAALPVYLNAMGRGALPPDPLSATRKHALANADVIVDVGAPLDFRLGYDQPPVFNADAKIIHIDIDAREIGRNRGADVGIVGDVRAVLEQLVDAVKSREIGAWLRDLRERKAKEQEKLSALANSDTISVHPLRHAKEIRDVLGRDTIVIGDGGNIVAQAARIVHVAKSGH